MSKKLSFDLDLNAQGFKQGINEAKGATAEYTNATRDLKKETDDYLKSFGSLRKQFGAAKKEAQNLAAQFAALGEAEKNSEYGKELAEELDIAIRKAAELQDVMSDVNEQIKNMASDTSDLDAFREGLDLAKSVTVGLTSAMAELTGSEAEAARLLKTLTTITAGYNAAIKLTSMLQANSKTMTALVNHGVISLTTATKVQTIATKALGTAMKALPFVAVTAGLISLGKAIYNYATAAESTEEKEKRLAAEEEKHQKKINDLKQIQESYVNTMATTFGQLMTKYNQLGAAWRKLSSEHEKQQWIKDNKTELNNLGIAVNSVKDAEEAFDRNRSKIVESFKQRAQAAAIAARMTTLYTRSLELESQYLERYNAIKFRAGDKDIRSDHTLDTNGETYNNGESIYNKLTGAYELTAKGAAAANKKLTETDSILVELNEDFKQNNAEIDTFDKRLQNLSVPNINTGAGGSTKVKVKPEVEETEVQKYEKQLKEQLDKAVEDYKLARIHGDEAAAAAAVEAYKKALAKQDALKIKIPVEIKIDETKNLEEFRKITEKLYEPQKNTYDFSGLSDAMQDAAEKSLNEINRLETAIKSYRELLKATKDPTLIEQIMEQLRKLGVDLDAATFKVKLLNEQSKSNTNFAKEIRDRGDAFGYYVQMLNGAANGLSALGDSEEVQAAQWAINSAAMIAQCVQNIAAMQAEAIASGTASGARLPFPANLAAIATIVATIGSIFASLPKFEKGGVIPGSSLFGDNVLIRANSRERVLTEEQNENFEKIANSVSGGAYNTQTIIVEGKIKGKDLLLVQKNYNTTATKAGQSIKF